MNQEHTLFPHAARTQPLSPYTKDFQLRHGGSLIMMLDISVVAGTTPTLDVKLQWKSPNGVFTDYIASAALFGQKNAAGRFKFLIGPNIASAANVSLLDTPPMVLRCVATLGADSDEVVTFSVSAQEIG